MRQRHAGWKLVRRRYEDHFGVLGKASGIQAVAINRDWQQPSTGSAEHSILACRSKIRRHASKGKVSTSLRPSEKS
jgi:hypothetical protein